MDDATVALRVERGLKPNEPDNFGIYTSDTLLGIYRQATTGIFAVLVGVVALSLLVGGIVIMNIMLMVVSDRTREIGLRKALGARRRDIMSQVLTESVTLSTAGGIAGITLGFLAAQAIAAVDAAAGAPRALVGHARHRHHGRRRPLLRRVPGVARRAAGSDRGVEAGMRHRPPARSRPGGARLAARQQDALRAHHPRRRHRHHRDRRHDRRSSAASTSRSATASASSARTRSSSPSSAA